jgi:hypothetical protein
MQVCRGCCVVTLTFAHFIVRRFLSLLVLFVTVNVQASLSFGVDVYQRTSALSTNFTTGPQMDSDCKTGWGGMAPTIGYALANETTTIMTGFRSPPLLALAPTMVANNDYAQEWGTVLDTIEYLIPVALILIVLLTACKREAADDLERMVMVMIS